jgi:site-specific DNA-methyltransferase (adenine-specific)
MVLCFRLNKYSNKQSHKELRDYFMLELEKSGFTVQELEEQIPNYSAHHWFRYSSDYRIPTSENYRRLQEITGCFQRPYEEINAEFAKEKNNLCTFNAGVLSSDVVYAKLEEDRVHPTQKPVALYKWLLDNFAEKGDKIIDTHVGSASSLIACYDRGFDAWGYEIDPVYYKDAKERLDAEMAQLRFEL